jgi:hypothetical protein
MKIYLSFITMDLLKLPEKIEGEDVVLVDDIDQFLE